MTKRQTSAHWERCGHPRTTANTAKSGLRWGTCRECKVARDRARRAATPRKPFYRNPEPAKPQPIQRQAPVIVPRGQRYAELMAEAKAAYQAALKREEEMRKGGRPKGSVTVGKGRNQFPNVQSDPADALVNALGSYSGAA